MTKKSSVIFIIILTSNFKLAFLNLILYLIFNKVIFNIIIPFVKITISI